MSHAVQTGPPSPYPLPPEGGGGRVRGATTAGSAEGRRGEVVDEFLERLGRGEQPNIEEFAGRYPQLAAVLRQMLPALQVMHVSAASHPRANGPLSTPIEPEGPLGDFRIVRE